MSPRITYCGNVHPADDLDRWLATLPRSAAILAGHGSGLGIWWNAEIAARLRHDSGCQQRVADALRCHGLELWTANVFPFGDFHAAQVKTAVYLPNWAQEERVQYTLDVARAVAACDPRAATRGELFALSTLPIGYGEVDLRLAARNLVRVASALAALEQETGLHCMLALEPEPCCVLETVAGTIEFFERWLLRPGSWTVAESLLRRHLGVCMDLCHLAVMGEDALAAATALQAAGIGIAKIQVSNALECRLPSALPELLAFAEPRYLHQTVAANGTRALDLDAVASRRGDFAGAGTLRTHFHVPLFWDDSGPLGSTQAELLRVLTGWSAPLPLLEVETYTFSVLPSALAAAGLETTVRQELTWLDTVLSRSRPVARR